MSSSEETDGSEDEGGERDFSYTGAGKENADDYGEVGDLNEVADSGWGDDEFSNADDDPEPEPEPDPQPRSTGNASKSRSTEESASQSRSFGTTVADLKSHEVRVDPTMFDDSPVPGTHYDIPYVYARTPHEKPRKWNRPGERRFFTHKETEDQLEQVWEYFDEEVYPDATVKMADICEAVLLAGIYHIDTTQAVLDSWGLKKSNDA